MHTISIDASPAQIRKLKKGLKVRIKQGTGFNLVVHPQTYNLVSRAFAKNKGVEVSLSNEEIAHNLEGRQGALPNPDQTMNEAPKGMGFSSPHQRKVSKKISGRGKFVEGMKDSTTRLVNAGVDRAIGAMEGSDPQNEAGTGGEGIFRRSRRMMRGRGKFVEGMKDSTTRLVNAGVDRAIGAMEGSDPQNEAGTGGEGLKKHVKGLARSVAGLARSATIAKLEEELNKQLGTNYGYLNRSNLDNAINSNIASQLSRLGIEARQRLAPTFGATSKLNPMSIVGGTLHEAGSVGRNGGMVSHFTPPALLSQPFSANWQLQFFLPPQYQHFNSGPAEHIGGAGVFAS